MSEHEMKSIIAENIAKYMRIRSITQVQIADYLGVSEASVSGWVHGKALPRMDKVDKLCELFGCTRNDLMSINDNMDPREKLLQEAFDSPDRRILFSLNEKATDQQIKAAIQFMKALLGEE